MIRSRRAAITASLLGALLIAGAPTIAFGDQDGTHEAKAYSAAATSDDMTAQKAKDGDDKKADDWKKDGDKKSADKKKDADEKKSADKKRDGDDKQAADKKKNSDDKKADDKKSADKKKDGDDKQAADKKRHDHGDAKKDDGKKDDHHDGDWKDKKHDDKWNRDWNHDRDRDHHRHDWDTHRRYYRYGYYGPGYYDDCGYYGAGYDGSGNDYSYYGPDACGYEYGGYRSHFLVDMTSDEVRGGGARDAAGTANLDIDVPAGVVCFRLAYDGIDQATGAQIHPGRRGEDGPSLVLLHVGQNGDDGCVGADPHLLSEIQNDPRGYYLQVDDEHGPAMRGQLDAPDYRNRY